MEYYFYEVWYEPEHHDIDHASIQAAVADRWLQHSDRSLLVLNGTFIVQGFVEAPNYDHALGAATTIASDFCRDGLGLPDPWTRALARGAEEQLLFINTGLKPEHQVPLHLQHIMEFSAAAIMRTTEPTEAALYRGTEA